MRGRRDSDYGGTRIILVTIITDGNEAISKLEKRRKRSRARAKEFHWGIAALRQSNGWVKGKKGKTSVHTRKSSVKRSEEKRTKSDGDNNNAYQRRKKRKDVSHFFMQRSLIVQFVERGGDEQNHTACCGLALSTTDRDVNRKIER